MEAGPRASIIVVNYNGCQYLDTCLAAVFSQELEGEFEVIVVDNGSSDGSAKYVGSIWPKARLVQSQVNLGFAAGSNLGIRKAVGKHVVLLNNDTRARPDWLKSLIEIAENDPSVGAVTSKLVFMERPEVIQNAGGLVLTDGSGGDRGGGEEDRGQFDRREEVFAACGAAVLLTRPMLEDVGVFDPTFFAYYEDTDLSWRMRLRGWRIVYEPAAVVEHCHAGTSIEWSAFFTFHVDRNRLFMILKNAPPAFALRAFAHFAWLSVRFVGRAMLRRVMRAARGQAPTERPQKAASRVRTHVRVVLSLLHHMPEMLAKRIHIRRRRRVADAEILRRLYPRELWDSN
jgi:GT2 family glycosyltransferase